MGRGLSAAAKVYTGVLVWLLDVTARSGANHFFATMALTFEGNTYLDYLRLTGDPTLHRGLKTDSADLDLVNADLVVEKLLETESFDLATAVLRKLYLGLDEDVVILNGRLTDEQRGQQAVSYRLVERSDHAAVKVPTHVTGAECQWIFKKPGCGYVDGVDPDDPGTGLPFVSCDKTHAHCTARGRTPNFNGIPTVTAQLVQQLQLTPGTAPGGNGGTGSGNDDGARRVDPIIE